MNLEQQSFITEYLRHRSAYTAYCRAYHVQDETKYDSIMSAAHRLLDDPEVGGVIRSILEGIRHDVEQELRAELKTDLLTVQRKREILAKIAAGEFYAVHNYKGKDCTMCSQHVWPTINQVLKAIDLDNKMAGLYSVDKPQHIADIKPVTEQSDKFPEPMVVTADQATEFQQNTTTEEKAPLLFLGGEHYKQRIVVCNSGEVDSCRTENATEPQQTTTIFVSPSERLGATYNKTSSGVGETTTNHNNFKPAPLERGGRGLTLPLI